MDYVPSPIEEDTITFPWMKNFHKNIIQVNNISQDEDKEKIKHENDMLLEELDEIHQKYKDEYEEKMNILREEIKVTHQVYRMKIYKLETELEDKEHNLKITDDRLNEFIDDNKSLKLKLALLIRSREDWIGRSLKFHYLFEEMNKIGLKQSDDIFEAYKDIEMPINEIPIQIRERYIPTELTNISVLDDDSEDSF
jgi:hypothetical protein